MNKFEVRNMDLYYGSFHEVNGLRAAAAKGRAQTRSASLQSKAAARRPKGPVGSGNAPAKRRK